ncbi:MULTISPECIES: extracellular solute-binding protein [unclassified Bradyrhizobium]|jgi:putative spermidine/putrescine transport system substrate-binding protein|uniref:extracellular solute-binding protein n=1 Tax=unclassified Bradyrhizobium TaxID=2631580 RepID=UPI0009EC0F29|nr:MULTISPECIES: extracellular solute-binding protein [unclassified Bradyrhizobium]
MTRFFGSCTLAILAVAYAATPALAQKLLTIYDLPSKYMDWGGLADGYDKKGLVKLTRDLKNGSSTALAAMKAEAGNPQTNGAYWALDIAVEAQRAGLTVPYKPKGFDAIPAALKEPAGYWWAVGSAYIVIGVNKDVLAKRNLKAPMGWADLLKPEYKGLVCSMDPTWSGTASVFMYGINFILGGSKDDFTPGMTWLRDYQKNGQQFRTEIVAPRLATGECPITIDAEGNILIDKLKGAPVDVVIPSEGVVSVNVGMSMAKGAPMPEETKAFFDWLLSSEAQEIIARAYFRPAIAGAVPPDVANVMPKVEKVVALDLQHQADVVTKLKRAFTDIVSRGGDLSSTLKSAELAK